MKNKQLILGYIFAIGATVIWSGNFIIARGLNQGISPFCLAFFRWFTAVVFILPFSLKYLILEWEVIKKNIGYLSIVSLLGVSIFNTLIYFSSHTTSAINLSLISITFPIFIIIFSRIFYNEEISIYKIFGIIIVFIGVIFLISKGNLIKIRNLYFSTGDVLMIIAAITFATYSVLLKHKPNNLNTLAFQSSTFILGTIILFPFFIFEYSTIPYIKFDLNIIFYILYLGVFSSIFAFILWSNAIGKIGPSKAGVIYYTLPIFSGFFSQIFLKENISILHLYSAFVIISGIFISNYEGKKIRISN